MGNAQGGIGLGGLTVAPGEQHEGVFCPNLWMVACRPFSDKCDTFTDNTLLFQPDTRILSNSYEYKYDREKEDYRVEETLVHNLTEIDTVAAAGLCSSPNRDPFPRHTTVLVYVHGFRQTYEKVRNSVGAAGERCGRCFAPWTTFATDRRTCSISSGFYGHATPSTSRTAKRARKPRAPQSA